MAKKNLDDPLVRFAQQHGGSLKVIALNKGKAYRYVYYENNLRQEEYFPAQTPPQKILDFILLKQGNIYAARNGYEPQFMLEHRARNRLTLAQLLDWYIEVRLREKVPATHARRDVRLESAKRTLQSYEYACNLLEKFLEAELASKNFPVEDLGREHLDRFKRWLMTYDGGRGGHGTNTINDMLGRITAMFRKAHYEKKISAYKFEGLQKLEREPVKKRGVLTLAEMKQIGEMEYLERRTMWPQGTEREDFERRMQVWWAYQIARFTAIRAQDIRRLRWQDFDFEKNEYNIWLAKARKNISVPFHQNLLKYREEYFRRLDGPPRGDDMFNFGMKELNRRFRWAIVKLKGESDLSWGSHTMRHSLATYLERTANWQIDDVGMFLCHDSGNVTHRYTHERLDGLREMIRALPLE